MNSILFEDPLPLAFMFLALAALVVVWWFQTGHKAALAFLGLILLSAGGFAYLEQRVVTEGEKIEIVLKNIRDALVGDDVAEALKYVSDMSSRRKRYLERMLKEYQVTSAKIGNDLEIKVGPETKDGPALARAYFTGRIEIRPRSGTLEAIPIVRKFTVELRQDDGQWQVVQYKDDALFDR